MARPLIVLEFDRSGLHAVEVSVGRAGVRLLGSTSAARPADVSADSADATGAWIRRVLDDAGLKARRVLVALPRDAAAVKQPELPAADASELPGMVALAVQRDLPFDAGDAVIDFVPLPARRRSAAETAADTEAADDRASRQRWRRGGGASTADAPAASGAPVRVFAAAISRDRLETVRATVNAAGRTLHGVTLRSLGSANLLARLAEVDPSAGAVGPSEDAAAAAAADSVDVAPVAPVAPVDPRGRQLILDIGDRGLELLVLEDGGVQFARATTLPRPDADPSSRVRAILTEARRTWMSYRVAEDGDVARAAVLGPPTIAEPVVAELQELLGVPVRRLDPRPAADADPGIADRVLESGGWPLVGLVLPAPEGRLDWTNPRQTPDHRRIAVRRAGLVAALMVIVAGGVWSFARREMADLRSELAGLQDKRGEVAGDYARLQRDIARRIHLQRWMDVDPHWLEHLAAIDAAMPPPGTVVLDGISGSLAYRGVDYDRRAKSWSSPFELTFVVEGEAATRAAAESVRGAFVDTELYRVSSTGGDGRAGRRLPVGFTYRLGTREAEPPSLTAASPADPSAAPGENDAAAATTDDAPADSVPAGATASTASANAGAAP